MDSPVVLDIESVLGVAGIEGHISVLNPVNNGNILVELSHDGINYGPQFTVFKLEIFSLTGLKVKKIRITHSGNNASYRVFAR